MTTYVSSQVSSGTIPINERGASFIVFGSIALTTALANNDIVQLVQVPNGYKVLNVVLDTDPLDSNAAPTLTGVVGDGTTANKFITTIPAAALKTGIVQPNNAVGSTGVVYPPASTGGNAGGTVLQFKCTANPATWVNGTMRLAVELQVDLNSFA